jgi:hypothetical protein
MIELGADELVAQILLVEAAADDTEVVYLDVRDRALKQLAETRVLRYSGAERE